MDEKPINTANLISNPTKRFFYRYTLQAPVEWAFGLTAMNRLYLRASRRNAKDPVEFCYYILEELGVSLTMPEIPDACKKQKGPLVVCANHPFGGLEALAMIPFMAEIRSDYKIMANYMLSFIKEIKDVLHYVDPFETKSAKEKNVTALKSLLAYMRNEGFLGIFPAGAVSTYNKESKMIMDAPWATGAARIILKTKAKVIPMYFPGSNSSFFHFAGSFHPMIRTALIPKENMNPTIKNLTFKTGDIIDAADYLEMNDRDFADLLRKETYKAGGIFLT